LAYATLTTKLTGLLVINCAMPKFVMRRFRSVSLVSEGELTRKPGDIARA